VAFSESAGLRLSADTRKDFEDVPASLKLHEGENSQLEEYAIPDPEHMGRKPTAHGEKPLKLNLGEKQ
jgi:hypothetical protein